MEDNAILDLYFARDELAITETDRKYGSYCYGIASRILCSREDCEETVSDTYFQTWNAIPPQRPDSFRLFLAKITRNLAFSRWRKLTAAKRGGGETELVLEELAQCIPGREQADDRLNLKELAATIQCFLETCPRRDRELFLLRYFYAWDTAAMAERFGIKRSQVNTVLSRTRVKLKIYLTQEGYDL